MSTGHLFLLKVSGHFSVPLLDMAVVRFYSNEAVGGRALQRAAKLYPQLSITSELCYNVELTGKRPAARDVEVVTCSRSGRIFHPPPPDTVLPVWFSAAGCQSLSAEQKEVLLWVFRPPLQTEPLSEKPNLTEGSGEKLVEIGPR